MSEPEASNDHLTFDKETKTVFSCTECGKQVVALLDYAINGNHIVECPHCGHEHCRVIEGGKITEERWSSRYGTDKTRAIIPRKVWKHSVLPAQTTTASEFIRARWLEKYHV